MLLLCDSSQFFQAQKASVEVLGRGEMKNDIASPAPHTSTTYETCIASDVLFAASVSSLTAAMHAGVNEIDIGRWTPVDDGSGAMRTIAYRYPLNEAMCPESTMVREVQRCKFDLESKALLLDTSCQSLDVPYGTSFTIESRLHFTADPSGKGCHCSITMQTFFSRSTMLEWKITSNAVRGSRDTWNSWCAFTQNYILEKKGGKRRKSRKSLGGGATPPPVVASPDGGANKGDNSQRDATHLVYLAAVFAALVVLLVIRVEYRLSCLRSLPGIVD